MISDEGGARPTVKLRRWECHNHSSPVLLAMVDDAGGVQIKVRNRLWIVEHGTSLTATCPKCGQQHTRQLSGE